MFNFIFIFSHLLDWLIDCVPYWCACWEDVEWNHSLQGTPSVPSHQWCSQCCRRGATSTLGTQSQDTLCIKHIIILIPQESLFKGTVYEISTSIQFVEWHVRFTTAPYQALIKQTLWKLAENDHIFLIVVRMKKNTVLKEGSYQITLTVPLMSWIIKRLYSWVD